MNHSSLAAVVLGAIAVGGCATKADSQGAQQSTLKSADPLTLTQCASQRDACLASDPLFGIFVCPAQYTLCAATASNGLPAQVNSAISDVAACTRDNADCTAGANTPAQLAACAETEAQCVASVVQDHLPKVVSGTAACVTDAIKCINGAEQVTDLTTCANNLESCAVTQVQTVVPPQVGQVIGNVASCETTLNSCVAAATTPAEVTTCSRSAASCVADSLTVTLPDVTVTGIVDCAETAAKCAIDAQSVADVTACTQNLRSCDAEAVGAPGNPPPAMTCAQKFTACLAQNPLNFLLCAGQLATCQN